MTREVIRNVLFIEPREKHYLAKKVLGINGSPLERITLFCDFLLIDTHPLDPLDKETGEVEGYNLATVKYLIDQTFFIEPTFIITARDNEKIEFKRLEDGKGRLSIGNAEYRVLPRIDKTGVLSESMSPSYLRKDILRYMFAQELGGVLL